MANAASHFGSSEEGFISTFLNPHPELSKSTQMPGITRNRATIRNAVSARANRRGLREVSDIK